MNSPNNVGSLAKHPSTGHIVYPSSEGTKTKSLMSNTVSVAAKDLLERATGVTTFLQSNKTNLKGKNLEVLHSKSMELLKTINSLFLAKKGSPLPIESSISLKKKDKKSLDVQIEEINESCTDIIKVCNDIIDTDSKINKSNSDRTQDSLIKCISKYLENVNPLFEGSTQNFIKIREKTAAKKISSIVRRVTHDQLHCHFADDKDRKQWDLVKGSIETYFKDFILIKLNQSEIDYTDSILLDIDSLATLLGHRYYLNEKRRKEKDPLKQKEIQQNLKRNEIHILQVYYQKLLEIQNALVSEKPIHYLSEEMRHYLNPILEILQKQFVKPHSSSKTTAANSSLMSPLSTNISSTDPKLLETLKTTFFSAISDSLKIYKDELERLTVLKAKSMLEAWNKENPNVIIDQIVLKEFHWKSLLVSERINMDEMKRALMNGCIWIVDKNEIIDGKRKIVLAPPKKIKPDEDPIVINNIINAYLPQTEQKISKQLGDQFDKPEAAILTLFRQMGYGMVLQKLQAEAQQEEDPDLKKMKTKLYEASAKETSILKQNNEVFKTMVPLMKKLEDEKVSKISTLTPEENGLLDYIEKTLKETNPAVIEKHGLKNIALILFSFHRILNQSFLIGSLAALKSVLKHIYPKDPKEIDSLEGTDSELFVEFGEDGKIALEWHLTNQIHSANWLFKVFLRMPIVEGNEQGDIKMEFIFEEVNKATLSSLSVIQKADYEKEKKIVEEIIYKIRLGLKALNFPDDAFLERI